MRWAVIDAEGIVLRTEESEAPPAVAPEERAVKGHDASCAVGRVWTGWVFEEVQK